MPIKHNLTQKHVEDLVDSFFNRLFAALQQALHNVGLKAVTIARKGHKYKDQTGNLSSSIGYVLLYDGVVVDENFQLSRKGTDKKTGVESGKSYVSKVMDKGYKGFQLIIVAGMPYATYVEAMGLDVLDSAEVYVKSNIKTKIEQVIELWRRHLARTR